MHKFIIYSLLFILCVTHADAATIKKADSVQKQAAPSPASSVGSLLPSVIGLVGGVMEMNKAIKDLSADCAPSASDVTFVDNMMKEFAKTGRLSRTEIMNNSKRQPCPDQNSSDPFSNQFSGGSMAEGSDLCFNTFSGTSNKGTIWEDYPRVGKAIYCDDGGSGCKNKKNASDIYEWIAIIDFDNADMLPNEATTYAKLMEKMERCAPSKIKAKQREMMGGFMMGAIGNMGQKTNTGNIMESVSGLTGSMGGGALNSIGAIGSIAGQFMAK